MSSSWQSLDFLGWPLRPTGDFIGLVLGGIVGQAYPQERGAYGLGPYLGGDFGIRRCGNADHLWYLIFDLNERADT